MRVWLRGAVPGKQPPLHRRRLYNPPLYLSVVCMYIDYTEVFTYILVGDSTTPRPMHWPSHAFAILQVGQGERSEE